MEPGEAGGSLGRDRGEGRDAPDFSDITNFDPTMGDFGIPGRAPGFSWGGAMRGLFNNKAVRGLLSSTPAGPVPGMIIDLAQIAGMKQRGFSDDEIDRQALGMMMGFIVPGAHAAAALGKLAQRGMHAIGSTGPANNPEMGRSEAGRVSDDPAVAFDRSNIDLARLAQLRRGF